MKVQEVKVSGWRKLIVKDKETLMRIETERLIVRNYEIKDKEILIVES